MESLEINAENVPVYTVETVIVGAGAAGFATADRLWELGHRDIVIVTDRLGAGTSRNAGSDKQTYYKLTLGGQEPDSVRELAQTLYHGEAMDGDIALAEAAGSASAFARLVDLGVPFPRNRFGEFVGYKTDHDPRRRATSVGPYTSRTMVECLEAKVAANGTAVHEGRRLVDLVTLAGQVVGVVCLRLDHEARKGNRFVAYRARHVVLATGGPAAIYGTRVYPHGQWGANAAALRAGASGKNLTEWQFGLASIHPRWNVSGSYMQVIPRLISTDASGGDEREFLTDFLPDYGDQWSRIFLKGYQWPFDVRKAHHGSSIIDLLVYQENVLRGRRVWLDFRRNPVRDSFDPSALSVEAREYLSTAGALQGTPIERLRAMNEPAYRFYRERNPSVDLMTDPLEIALCAQHNNGGIGTDAGWQSDLGGLFAVGEAAGTHGVYRPGGAALNAGQVGAMRAAISIVERGGDLVSADQFAAVAQGVVAEADALIHAATASGQRETTGDVLRLVGSRMSAAAGPIRSAQGVWELRDQVRDELASLAQVVDVDPSSRQSVSRLFLLRDTLLTQWVYLGAMADYLAHGGRSRGAVLYTDPEGELPEVQTMDGQLLPEQFRFRLDGGALAEQIQEARWSPGAQGGQLTFTWRQRRPIPEPDEFFETVWREFRENQAAVIRI